MEIKKIIDFGTDENCYILINGDSCVVIDPGEQEKEVSEFIKEKKLNLKNILLTHCHWDHSAGAKALKAETGAEVIASEECRENIRNSKTNVSELFGAFMNDDIVDKTVSDGEKINVGGIGILCLKTPGHTSCSVCYIHENMIFSGDTLFKGSVGRWDFPTGNYQKLEESIKNKLYKLDDYIVYPGHGAETTTDTEKKYNGCISGD